MNKADTWLNTRLPVAGNTRIGNANSLAMDTAARIAESPETVVLKRTIPVSGRATVIELPPQVCRVEIVQSIRSGGEQRDFQRTEAKQYVVILAVRDHPTLPNFDVRYSDWFMRSGRRYDVVEIDDAVPGRLLISAELTP